MNQVDCCCEGVDVSIAPFQEMAEKILQHLSLTGVELSIVLCNNSFIHPLNRDYRGKDRPTDVLSFSQREGGNPEDPMLGDVIISIERAKEQAFEHNNSVSAELSLLLVHGILHLLGYDHEDDEEAEEMEAKEKEILCLLDVERFSFLG